MKLQVKLGLATMSLLALAAVAGCPVGNVIPGTNPSPSTGPGNSLQGRMTFALGTNSNPGQQLTARLKSRSTGTTANFAATGTTTSTDTSGNFSFSGLTPADYQVYFDDQGSVATTSFNVAGVVVSDPVTVSASQSSAPQVNLELAWNFTTGAAPAPNGTVTSGSTVNFSFPAKNGYSDAVYQVTIFSSSNTASGALQSFPSDPTTATSALTLSGTLNTNVTAGQRFYVVKYWKTGGTFNGPNYYGQTKPIPITVQ